MSETSLKYEVHLPNDGTHDQGISLHPKNAPFGDVLHNIVVQPEDKTFFQRIKVYSSGLITSEEVRRDKRTIRFNVPYEKEGDNYLLDV